MLSGHEDLRWCLHLFRNTSLRMRGGYNPECDHRPFGNEEHVIGKQTKSPSMTTGRVDRPLLAANHEVIDVSRRESHSGNSHRLGLVVHQLHALLPKHDAVTFPLSTPRHAKDSTEKSFGQIVCLLFTQRYKRPRLCQQPCRAAPATRASVSLWFQAAGFHQRGCFLSQAEMTGENFETNGAETKDNTVMVTLVSPRL